VSLRKAHSKPKKATAPKSHVPYIVERTSGPDYSTTALPFETEQLRLGLTKFMRSEFPSASGTRIGSYKWGVYAFYDFDNEPIYVGQTNERLSGRVSRHLTNQRTDAVAMRVLDPFEVCYLQLWPLPEYQQTQKKDSSARRVLNQLEYTVYQHLLSESVFSAVLNEKLPVTTSKIKLPPSLKAKIVSVEVSAVRDHPDLRIARRAATLAALARIIGERKVQSGLRRVLWVQARRLEWLAKQRLSRPKLADEEKEAATSGRD